MPLRVYNTLTRRIEDFVPLEPGKVKMYCCGPTVYDYIGIHNARTIVTFDVIRRYLLYRGYDVTYVQNITDIDDKIIDRAKENRADAREWAKTYTEAFNRDMERLRVRPPDIAPRATGTICEIRGLIRRLFDVEAAYETTTGVYFRVDSFPEYGKLSHRSPEDVLAGARIDVDEEKRDPRDFVLWKRAKIGEPWWESPWGEGRPGWHIECSAMIMKHLGESIDIHAGGADLIFPHHENEIAQSEKATGKPFVKYWLHGGLLRVGGKRMGKSLGNFIRVHDAVERYPVEAIRLFLLSTHYRKPLEYTDEAIPDQVGPARRLNRCLDALAEAAGDATPLSGDAVAEAGPSARAFAEAVEAAERRFIETVDHDFNFPGGIGILFDFVRDANRFLAEHPSPSDDERAAIAAAHRFLNTVAEDVFGIRATESAVSDERIERVLDLAVQVRQEARAAKDWATADRIRDALAEAGVTLHDSREGTTWERAGTTDLEAIVGLLVALRSEARAEKDWARADALRDALAEAGVLVHDAADGSTWEWAST